MKEEFSKEKVLHPFEENYEEKTKEIEYFC